MHWQPIEEASKEPGQVVDLWVANNDGPGFRIPNCHWSERWSDWVCSDLTVLVSEYIGDSWRNSHFMVVRGPGEEEPREKRYPGHAHALGCPFSTMDCLDCSCGLPNREE